MSEIPVGSVWSGSRSIDGYKPVVVAVLVSIFLHALVGIGVFWRKVEVPYVGRGLPLVVRLIESDSGGLERQPVLARTAPDDLAMRSGKEEGELARGLEERRASQQSPDRDLKFEPAPEPAVTEAPLAFVPVEKLSVRPYPINLLEGVGPPDVDPADMHGGSVLKLYIGLAGDVVETVVVRTDMPESLIKSVEGAFRRMRFMPGMLEGKPVASVMTVAVDAVDFALPAQ